ncbi:MAG: ATP-binding protein [Vicinamibacterales bacterium]
MWSPEAGPLVTARWLARFRWAVAAGAAATMIVAWTGLDVELPVTGVAALIVAHASSNLWLHFLLRRGAEPSEPTLGGFILFDIGILTAPLVLTGGPSNPFTIAYLVYITLSAVTLNASWTWAAAVLSMAGYGVLFITPLRALVDPHAMHTGMAAGLSHQVGMGVAFVVAALLTASFVTRIRLALEAREQALAEARRVAARQDRLASLTTLAAGAAHELATPLSAIAVAARELDRAANTPGVPSEVAEDARLIRSQVERCRDILDQMSGRADASVAHAARTLPVSAVVDATLDTFDRDRPRVVVSLAHDLPPVRVPLEAAVRALRTLVKNALEASAPDARVQLFVSTEAGEVRFRVEDHGVGMAADTLQRAGEPFFTTKPTGAGFGLGLFLARTFAEHWGGTLTLSSAPGDGTTATLRLPTAPSGTVPA